MPRDRMVTIRVRLDEAEYLRNERCECGHLLMLHDPDLCLVLECDCDGVVSDVWIDEAMWPTSVVD